MKLIRNYARIFNSLRNVCFGYLLESPHLGDSNKNPKHVLWGNKNNIRPFLHIILLTENSLQHQIILLAVCLGTNAVMVTRVHCICSVGTLNETQLCIAAEM